MLNIALISEHASPLAAPGGIDCGGQNVYVAQLACQLAAQGHRVDVYTRRDDPGLPRVQGWRDRLRVVHIDAGPPRFVRKEDMLSCMDDFIADALAFARRQPRPYDLAHANFFMSGLAAREMGRALAMPFVITFHALGLVRRLALGAADDFPQERPALEQGLMRDAARIIAECPQDSADMVALYGADRERIAVVPCGFDPDELWPMRSSARARLGLPADAYIVLQLGRIVPRKGIDNVLDAVALLARESNVRATLLVAGGPATPAASPEAAELDRLRALAGRLGLDGQVRFTGPIARSRLRDYYSAADVFVTTPWYEPFGITPLEAMACATPVIGADVGGIKATVVDGHTGYLVPPRDPHALAARLVDLHGHPMRARRLGMAGWRRAHEAYTWRRVAEQVLDVYFDALAGLRPPAAAAQGELR